MTDATNAKQSLTLAKTALRLLEGRKPGVSAAATRRTATVLILAVTAALFATPASAQRTETIWSATMTVGRQDPQGLGGVGFNGFTNPETNSPTNIGGLSPDTFTAGGSNYAVERLTVTDTGELKIAFYGPTTMVDGILRVGTVGTPFAMSDADRFPILIESVVIYTWSNSGLSWNVGDTVAVRLTAAATNGGDDGPRETVPDAPRNLLADATEGAVTLTWDAPKDDGGAAILGYEYRIDGRGRWISTGSTLTTHTVRGLVNGTVYAFQVRAVNQIGESQTSNRAEATLPVVLDFAHFANGTDITSEMVLVSVATHPIQPALYFYDQEGHLIDPESVVDVTVDLEVTEDGSLTVRTEMAPLGQLTISTHGRGDPVSGSVRVVSDGPIGGGVRYGIPEIGVAGAEAGPPVRDVLFPARRQAGGIHTAAALHNLGEEAMEVRCRLMSGGSALEEVEMPLEANGQTYWFIEDAFTATDTSAFAGSVRCTASGRGRFTAIAVEMDAAGGIFTTLPVARVDRTGTGSRVETALDFAHFANGSGLTSDLVFVNLSTQASRRAPSPFHPDIHPSRPAIYFFDAEGNPIAATSVVDVMGDLEIQEDGSLTVRTEMAPLGVLTISTHGRGDMVTGSVKVVSEGPIGGVLRLDIPGLGVAGVGDSPPVRDALVPVRRQTDGINTGVAVHNRGAAALLARCQLMRAGAVLEETIIPLAANGQDSRFIDQVFPTADTSDFSGSVRCLTPEPGRFSAVAFELDGVNRIFTTLPVVPVVEVP